MADPLPARYLMHFPPQKQAIEQHYRDPYANGTVGNIERRPMPRSGVKVEKINDGAEANSIDHVADGATDDQSDRNGEQRALDAAQPIDQHGDDRCSDKR